MSSPRASIAAIADDRVQPVPCVFTVSTDGADRTAFLTPDASAV